MSDKNNKSGGNFGLYASGKIIIGVIVATVILVGGFYVIKFFSGSSGEKSPYRKVVDNNPTLRKMNTFIDNVVVEEAEKPKTEHKAVAEKDKTETVAHEDKKAPAADVKHEKKTASHETAKETSKSNHSSGHGIKPIKNHATAFGSDPEKEPQSIHVVRGSRFATALIEPINYEVNERAYGWRPNDIFSFFTDNIENYQLGVLDVTRRTSERLVERIARTGSAVKFDRNLDSARSKFNNDPTKYWMPSPEAAYDDAIDDIKEYRGRLNKGKAAFHARADNLVPLLEAYENLLGDCDEELVKREERNGSKVSTFKADDYFYYAKGVASSMRTILDAVAEDFGPVLASRGADANLYHAIEELEHASHLSPLFIQESSLSGFFANHRANMATFISHARAYLQDVLKTMTT